MFKLEILFIDNSVRTYVVKRVSNLSSRSEFLYFEELYDERGHGTTLPNSSIKCFECNVL